RLEFVERIVMRHVRRERDFAESLAAIGTNDGELAFLELDVGVRCLEEMRCDLFPLRDNFVDRLHDRRTADGERPRAVGSHSERISARIAVHDVATVDRDAESIGDNLRDRRLVTLAVAVRAREHGYTARRMHANLTSLIETGARAERTSHVRRGQSAG